MAGFLRLYRRNGRRRNEEGKLMISFRDLIATRAARMSLPCGVLIGVTNQTWLGVLVSSAAWAFVVWLYIVMIAGPAKYTPGTALFVGSEALSRFVVWWTTAAATSLVVGSIVFAVRQNWK
jgi:hypothetical protein